MLKLFLTHFVLYYFTHFARLCSTQETMNSQGLYQAVRSRLHFSQVAAWWSRSSGSNPVYVATRVVPYNEDHLRKFREHPVEHTFPLASSGDGNSIKVCTFSFRFNFYETLQIIFMEKGKTPQNNSQFLFTLTVNLFFLIRIQLFS